MEAGVDVDHVARDAAREVRQEEGGRVADFVDRDRAAEGRRVFHDVQKLGEILDARGGEGLDGTSRNGVRTDAAGTKARSKIARARFQSGLGKAHRVVVGHHAFAAEVAERQNGTLAAFHQREAGLRERGEGIGGNVHRDLEGFAGKAFEEVSGDRFAGGEADRVHDAVERTPGFADAFHGGLNFFVAAHVHLKDEIAAELFGKSVNAVAGTVSRIGEGKLGPFTMASLGDAVGDGTVGKQPRNQNLLTSKKTHGQYSL